MTNVNFRNLAGRYLGNGELPDVPRPGDEIRLSVPTTEGSVYIVGHAVSVGWEIDLVDKRATAYVIVDVQEEHENKNG